MNKNLRLELALSYISRGWAVLPLHSAWITKDTRELRCSCVKGFKCKNKGKHPRIYDGSRGASKDPKIITEWWDEWPMANLGVATGKISDFWVIDIDFKTNNGWDSLEKEYGTFEIDNTKELVQKTTSGGFHILVEWDDVVKPMNKVNVLPGVDIRSDGGYIVVAPSTIGPLEYQWNNISNLPAPYKDWTLDFAQKSLVSVSALDKGNLHALDLEEIYQRKIPEGERDDTLVRIAGKLLTANTPYELAMFIMIRMGERCEPFDAEIQEKITSVLDYVYQHYSDETKNSIRKHKEERLQSSALLEEKFLKDKWEEVNDGDKAD